MSYNKYIGCPSDLVTSREEIRSGFINFALEKSRKSTPYIEQAKVFRQLSAPASSASDLVNIEEIQQFLLTAAGLSAKAIPYFKEADKKIAIDQLIKKFLEPAEPDFIDEAMYRYLLIKGDSLGGSMRNLVGALAEQKFLRTLLAAMSVRNIDYKWISSNKDKKWKNKPDDETKVESRAKAISWSHKGVSRTLAINLNIPLVKKNIDICLFDCDSSSYSQGKIVNDIEKIIMLGELKGGIDPAGADEHWKTANTALSRIRDSFDSKNKNIKTSFIGAAIENSMAEEIYDQLEKNTLANAANLLTENQLIEFCNWILDI